MSQRMGFAVFHWVTDAVIAAKGDGIGAFFAEEFASAVHAKGGTDPALGDYVEVSDEQMALLEINPRPGARLFRLYGHATAPAGVEPLAYEITG